MVALGIEVCVDRCSHVVVHTQGAMLSKFAAAVLFVTITMVVAPYFSAAVFVGMLRGLLHFSVASVVALVCVALLCFVCVALFVCRPSLS